MTLNAVARLVDKKKKGKINMVQYVTYYVYTQEKGGNMYPELLYVLLDQPQDKNLRHEIHVRKKKKAHIVRVYDS